MNRYNLVHGRFAGEPTAELELEDDGAWVLYRDVSDEIEQCRNKTIQECWDTIDNKIMKGKMPKHMHGQRNGMVLACNILMEMLRDSLTTGDKGG